MRFGATPVAEYFVVTFVDLTGRVEAMAELAAKVRELEDSAHRIRTLLDLLPVCAWCRKCRNDQGDWQALEVFMIKNLSAQVTHGMCPECAAQYLARRQPT